MCVYIRKQGCVLPSVEVQLVDVPCMLDVGAFLK